MAGTGTLKVKTGDWISCDETVREMVKHLQDTSQIGDGSEFIEAELDGGLFVKKGFGDLVVARIHEWIDKNATLDKPDKRER